MADYKKMYYTMFWAAEEAINLLIAAQRECEELYISQPDAASDLPCPEDLLPLSLIHI